MSVVPSVVINEDCSVGHACNLIAIIPPTHDLSLFGSVLLDPIISFSVVIDDVS